MAVLLFPYPKLVNAWIDSAEFGCDGLNAHGRFYCRNKRIPAIRDYVSSYTIEYGRLPTGRHVVSRRVGMSDRDEFGVTFPAENSELASSLIMGTVFRRAT